MWPTPSQARVHRTRAPHRFAPNPPFMGNGGLPSHCFCTPSYHDVPTSECAAGEEHQQKRTTGRIPGGHAVRSHRQAERASLFLSAVSQRTRVDCLRARVPDNTAKRPGPQPNLICICSVFGVRAVPVLDLFPDRRPCVFTPRGLVHCGDNWCVDVANAICISVVVEVSFVGVASACELR